MADLINVNNEIEQNDAMINGAYVLMDSLVRNGTKHIFGYPGGAILPIYDELFFWEKDKLIKHVLVRHEQGAIHAADAYARSSGKIGVCFATSGPGATNLVTGIATAQMDSVPLVIITGQVARSFIGTDAFQETDIFGITLPIVKHSYVVREAKSLVEIIPEAFYIAKNGRPGPILIDIPKDVGLETVPDYYPIKKKQVITSRYYRFDHYTSQSKLEQACQLIRQASQPLAYVGGGAVIANAAKEIEELVNYFRLPITNTLTGKGSINESNRFSLGMLGMHGTAYANFAVSECDLLLAIGARFDDRVTGKLDEFACRAKVIHIDIDAAEVGKNRVPEIAIIGDVRKILQELISIERNRPPFISINAKYWRKRIRYWQRAYPLLIPRPKDALSPQHVIHTLGRIAPNAYFTTDVGQHQMWAAQFIQCKQRRWMSSAGLGTMGYGLPAAIGTQFAFPDDVVICISGDASFQMNLQELGTIAQYNLPIKIALINNKWQGMVRQWQQAFYDNRYSNSSMAEGMPDFVRLANSYQIKAHSVNSPDGLEEAIDMMINTEGPVLIDFQVVSDENCYPMVAPGKSNDQMVGVVPDLEKQSKLLELDNESLSKS